MAQKNTIYMRRKFINGLSLGLSMLAMLFGLATLATILGLIVFKGFDALNLELFTRPMPVPGSEEIGGLQNAIIGSLIMVATGTAIGTPIGVMAGIYLSEYGKNNWIASSTRFINDILLSAPSIVVGIFVYTLMVATDTVLWDRGYSGWAGAVALAILVIPVVVRTTENMLQLIPVALREASAALGTPQWKTTTFVTVKAAMSGILTGIILAVARISGETAPLLFTALADNNLVTDMSKPMSALPTAINTAITLESFPQFVSLAWAGAFIITAAVLALNIIARTAIKSK